MLDRLSVLDAFWYGEISFLKGLNNGVHALPLYKDKEGKEFFIKKPTDKKELFTELFAGKILQQFVKHDILDEKAASCLIYAD